MRVSTPLIGLHLKRSSGSRRARRGERTAKAPDAFMCNETTRERTVTFKKRKWGRMGWGGGVGIFVVLLAACQSSSVAQKKKAKAAQPAPVIEAPPPASVAAAPATPP